MNWTTGIDPVARNSAATAQAAAATADGKASAAQVDATKALDDAYKAAPPGMTGLFSMATPPAGWLKANGAAVSRASYAALFAAIGTTHGAGDGVTTFNLPDDRAEFFRGLDDGRGVDVGRTIGSAQADEMRSHAHVQSNTATGGSSWMTQRIIGAVGSGGFGNDATSSVGGTETRGRNVAKLACIKY